MTHSVGSEGNVTMTCVPGVDDDESVADDSADEIDVDVEDETASSPVTSDAESNVCSSSLDEEKAHHEGKLPKKSGGFSIDDIMRRWELSSNLLNLKPIFFPFSIRKPFDYLLRYMRVSSDLCITFGLSTISPIF